MLLCLLVLSRASYRLKLLGMNEIYSEHGGESSESFLFVGYSNEYMLSKSHDLQILTKFREFSFQNLISCVSSRFNATFLR